MPEVKSLVLRSGWDMGSPALLREDARRPRLESFKVSGLGFSKGMCTCDPEGEGGDAESVERRQIHGLGHRQFQEASDGCISGKRLCDLDCGIFGVGFV